MNSYEHETEMNKLAGKLQNKYIGIQPMLLIAAIALIIIYYHIFSSLGNNEDGSASAIKVFVETLLWLVFIVLLLLNGISYIFGFDLLATLNSAVETESADETEIKIYLREKEQVFNLPDNKYTYADAKAICKAYDSRLATYDDMSHAYDMGADWCSYGWSADQMALFPTQKAKWEKLQKQKGHEQDCGRPGINGGYVYDVSMAYGVNCYGPKPAITKAELDQMRNKPFYNKTNNELNFDSKVNYWRSKLSQIELAPFNHDNWSML